MVRVGRFVLVASIALLTACAAHEKAGDSAAAVGDWKRALSEYRTAVEKSPSDAKLRQKYEGAKTQATATSTRKAQACAAQGNWDCALGEADFAISVDDGAAATLGALRADAARNVALGKVASARAAVARNDLDGALKALRTASSLSTAPDVTQAVRAASVEWAASAASTADQLRQSRRYPEALSLLSSAAEYDPSLRPRVVALQGEYEQFKGAEHDRLVAEGDAALAAKRWSDAAASFQMAQQMRADARAAASEKYAGSMASGENAVSRSDWNAAQQAFRAALDSGQDKGGDAARAVEAVTVRTYAVRISSIFVQPARPDGEPWVGKPSPLFGKLVTMAANVYLSPVVGGVVGKVVTELDKIPPENQPTLVVEVTLPDGRRFVTSAHRGLYWNPPSQVTVATNAYDQRPLIFRVVHREPNGSEQSVGMVQVPLSELATKHQAVLKGASIAQLELTANPGTAVEGSVSQDLKVVPDATNAAPSASTPSPGAAGFKLARVATQVIPPDYQDDGFDGPPDLFVEVLQGGRVVYRSPAEQDKYEAAWIPERTFIFVRPDEAVSVLVWDKDISDNDRLLSYDFTVREMASGTVEAKTQRGSFVHLSFEPRRGEP